MARRRFGRRSRFGSTFRVHRQPTSGHDVQNTKHYDMVNHERYSWGEFVDRAESNPNPRASVSNGSSDSWDMDAGFHGAVKLARDGWPAGEAHVNRLSEGLFDYISSLIEREYPVYDVEGSEIDVARYLEGEPECWIRMDTRITEGPGRKVVSIVYNATASFGVDANVLCAKGAAVVALAELLEFAGNSVELSVISTVEGHSGGKTYLTSYSVHVKSADQPLDVSRAAFALAHPACFRRLGFAINEQYPHPYNSILNEGYGYIIPPLEDEKGDLYISHSTWPEDTWTSPEKARAWIIEQLKAQGVSVNTEGE